MQDAIEFLRERGDFEHPAFLQVQPAIPRWLAQFGTESGIAEFEAEFQVKLPPAVKFYVQHPDIACVIEAGCDLDAFLNQMKSRVEADPPFVLYYDRHAYLVIAFHNHSGGVCAVDLAGPDSLVRFGDADVANFDLRPQDETAVKFEQWIGDAIRGARLDDFHSRSQTYPVRRD